MKKLIMFLFLSVCISLGVAQTVHDGETKSEIPELNKFHAIIYQLWHTAWPNKDVSLLKKLMPDIESGYGKISEASLPGILRDKKPRWDAAVKELGATIAVYKTAASAADTIALLKATEKLHMQYEGLVRIVKPVLKEIDNFHQVLYLLYHYYLPEYNDAKIKSSAAELKMRMDSLNAAPLYKELDVESLMKAYPSMQKENAEKMIERRKVRNEKFIAARGTLSESVKMVYDVVNGGKDKETVTKAIKSMHSDYEALEKEFD
jgi:hypothetical protein